MGDNTKVYFLTQFTDLGLAEPVLRALSNQGYETPTPIQSQVIPAMQNGRDIMGIAQTGTGKTAAFVLPILTAILKAGKKPQKNSCTALIMAPTRELAMQIAESVVDYGQFMRATVAVVVGGVKPGPQIRALKEGVDIVIATPGRLEDHLQGGALSLKQTRIVVLDEADQMLDMGFIPAIRRIMGLLPKQRQTALLSATMPKQISGLARDFLNNPEEISVTPISKPIERIDQSVMMVPKASKRHVLSALVDKGGIDRAIVFARTKRGADRVGRHLEASGHPASVIHGNKSQNQRNRALDLFKSGEVRILVATDIAARGIDIDDVSHVFNFDLPDVAEAYVHRIGRTARAGRSGVAISFCDGAERQMLKDIERLTKQKITVVETPELDEATIAKVKKAEAQAKEQAKAQNGSGSRGGRGRNHNAGRQGQRPRRSGGNKGGGARRGGGQGRGKAA
ncbi:MAG: DEAD/DEAH box helicase [Alphaproteobacteria bacterium]